jgi:chromosome segregation ATPase
MDPMAAIFAAQKAVAAQQQQTTNDTSQLATIQEQLTTVTNDLAGSQQQVQKDEANLLDYKNTLASYQNKIGEYERQVQKDATDISDLTMQIHNCTAQDYTNIKNLLKTYTTAVQHNASLVKSATIQDNVKRLEGLEEQNAYLKQKKAELVSSIEQHERDFVDMRDALPEVLPNTSLHTLDDYTLWILILSYSLFVVSMIFYYCYVSNYTITSILVSSVSAVILTIFLFIIMIIVL